MLSNGNNAVAPPITIDESNVKTGVMKKYHTIIYDLHIWHKIIVDNSVEFSKDVVLTTIMDAVRPYDFTPLCYTSDGDSVSFLLKSCGAAIGKLCRMNLTVPFPGDLKDKESLKLTILLRYAHTKDLSIDIKANISHILRKRYDSSTRMMNLESFSKDPDLLEFCPLSQVKMLSFVLLECNNFTIEILKMADNGIHTLKPFTTLKGRNQTSLRSVDLSKNDISSVKQMDSLSMFPINEVFLEENPICEKLTQMEYIQTVKKLCPKLNKLDGIPLQENGTILKRNYLCDPSGFDFVDHFLEHYFLLFDSPNRQMLENVYHKKGMFSLVCRYLRGHSTSIGARLAEFRRISRNLKTMKDISKSDELLFVGRQDITRVLDMLPQCEHDPTSFTIDLMQFSDSAVIFTVTGVFKDTTEDTDVHIYGFLRTFVLIPVEDEYHIVNEIFQVSNATTWQHIHAFKELRNVVLPPIINIPLGETPSQQQEMVRGLVHITGLRFKWAKKCLVECEYNLKRALILCVDLVHTGKFPALAFGSYISYFPEVENYPEIMAQPMPAQPTPSPLPPAQPNNNSDLPVPLNTVKPEPVDMSEQNDELPVPINRIKPEPVDTPPIELEPELPVPVNNIKPEPMVTNDQIVTPPINSTIPQAAAPPVKNEPIDLPEFRDAMFDVATPPLAPVETKTNPDPAMPVLPPRELTKIQLMDADDIIKDALNIPMTTTKLDAKFKILKASKRLVGEFTYHTKYYRALGREFYKYKLLKEARTFLDDIMAHVPKKIGEEVFSAFALFEIQFGDINVAEEMIKVTVLSYPIKRTIKFIGEHIVKINVEFARKMFIMGVQLPISSEFKNVLFKAYADLEFKFGTIENVNVMNALKMKELKIKPEADPEAMDVVVSEAESDEFDGDERATGREILYRTNKFKLFRKGILAVIDIVHKVDKQEVKEFVQCKENLLEIGAEILENFPDDRNVLSAVCEYLWSLGFTEEVIDLLDKNNSSSAKFVQVLYKIRNDILKSSQNAAYIKVIQHIRTASLPNTANLFESLITHESDFAEHALPKCVNDTDLPITKRRIIALQFWTLALFTGNVPLINEAKTLNNTLHDPIDIFHPDDVLHSQVCEKFRKRYESTTRNDFSIVEAKTMLRNTDNIQLMIESTRSLYFHYHVQPAREERHELLRKLNKDDKILYIVSVINFEALFGDPKLAMGFSKKLDYTEKNSYNVQLALASCHIQLKENEKAKAIVQEVMGNLNQIMHPYMQEGLYKYYQDWAIRYNVDLLELGFTGFS